MHAKQAARMTEAGKRKAAKERKALEKELMPEALLALKTIFDKVEEQAHKGKDSIKVSCLYLGSNLPNDHLGLFIAVLIKLLQKQGYTATLPENGLLQVSW